MHRPRKRFGQNFLHDAGVIQRIVRTIAPRPGQHIVEIGPGHGALTLPLLETCGELDVVELDRDLIRPLADKAAGRGVLRIHVADALEFDFGRLAGEGQRLRVVGNLPYNISTPLLFHLIAQIEPAGRNRPLQDMHFMLQKEVVDRLAAVPGSGEYGRLSVMVQYHCRVDPLFRVRPGAFTPAPKVDSAVVRLTPRETPPAPLQDATCLAELVRAAFSQRRKTLRNTLKQLLETKDIEAAGVDPGARAETLEVEQFVALANRLASRRA